MKAFLLVSLFCMTVNAQNIITITNVQGRAYHNIHIVRTNDDGLIYSLAGSDFPIGLIIFTNLSAAVLERLGIPTNRISAAIERANTAAKQKAKADSEERQLEIKRDLDAQSWALSRIINMGFPRRLTNGVFWGSYSKDGELRDALVLHYHLDALENGQLTAKAWYVGKYLYRRSDGAFNQIDEYTCDENEFFKFMRYLYYNGVRPDWLDIKINDY